MVLHPHSFDPELECKRWDGNGFTWSELVAEIEADHEQSATVELEQVEAA